MSHANNLNLCHINQSNLIVSLISKQTIRSQENNTRFSDRIIKKKNAIFIDKIILKGKIKLVLLIK